jgi:hypothetical protein
MGVFVLCAVAAALMEGRRRDIGLIGYLMLTENMYFWRMSRYSQKVLK